MKTKITILSLIASIFMVQQLSAQVDLVPGINYSYNPPGSNGIITDIEVDAVNNGSSSASAFDVAMYLYEQSSGNYWIIGTTRLTNGLSGNALITISNWNININNTPGIPAGTYRLGLWMDSSEEISESDENNNAGLLSGNINYTPVASAVVEFSSFSKVMSLGDIFPNPAQGLTQFQFSLPSESFASLVVFDITGKVVAQLENKALPKGTYTYEFDAGTIEPGVYFYSLNSDGKTITKKLIVTR